MTFKLEELGTTKAAVKRCFTKWYERPADDAWAAKVMALLAPGRCSYSLDELETLVEVFATSHHACVLENQEDYHRLTVAMHIRLEAQIERWLGYIADRRAADAGVLP